MGRRMRRGWAGGEKKKETGVGRSGKLEASLVSCASRLEPAAMGRRCGAACNAARRAIPRCSGKPQQRCSVQRRA